MELYNYVETTSEDECFSGDGFFIAKESWFEFKRITNGPISVDSLKENEGDAIKLPITFRGSIEVKIGVKREAYSFSWVCEKHLESTGWATQFCTFDLSRFESGELEITFLGLDYSAVIFNIPQAKKIAFPRETELYSFISPSYDLCCEEQIYYRFSGTSVYYSFEDGYVHMEKNTSVDLLTYFNAFSACKWHKYTNIENLSAYIDFQGEADVFIVHKDKTGQRYFKAFCVKAEERGVFELPMGSYPETGLLGLFISASKKSVLYGGGWLSPDPEVQHVRLGIGITTFKREDAAKAAVARLSKAISGHPLYSGCIDITVVDNGQTLAQEDLPGATLVPNRNLGGTGGFTNSLIRYQETGVHTHCLFMDDDASCEASSIFRSMSFIRHATDPRTSLSGAMLFENIQFQQWENGAWFDGGCHSLKRDFDMRDPERLLENEEEPDERIYGAWWFFFFPLAEAKNYSLPFFVRGDDIDFSYNNDFEVLSLNGVSCWQQDFKTKESAMTAYLFLRSHVVHHLTIPFLKCGFRKIWKILWGHFREYNNSYYYGTAACVNLAMRHIMQGPAFWEKNMVPVDILKQIKELSACEKAEPYTELELKMLEFADKNIKTKLGPAFIRKASLYGHLLPSFMIRHTPRAMIYKWMTPNKKRVYMRDQVIVIDELQRKKIVLKRDPRHYLGNLAEFLKLSFKMYCQYDKLRKQYIAGTQQQRTRAFWKKQFGE